MTQPPVQRRNILTSYGYIIPSEGLGYFYIKKLFRKYDKMNLDDLSMGMSKDYLDALENEATYIRLGSKIFGKRT